MPVYNLPSKILCRVVNVNLKVLLKILVEDLRNWLILGFSEICRLVIVFSLCYFICRGIGWTWHRWGLCSSYLDARTKCKLNPWCCTCILIWDFLYSTLMSFAFPARWECVEKGTSSGTTTSISCPFFLQDSYCIRYKHPWGFLGAETTCWWMSATTG